MRNTLLIFIACLSFSNSYSQVEVKEKEFINKYNLKLNFFSRSFNAKEYLRNYYDSLSTADSKKILPPENLVNEAGHLFLLKNMFKEAYQFFKLNIENYPESYLTNSSMGDYYKKIGDKDRSFVYYSRGLLYKYKQPSVVSNPSLKFDSAITAEYSHLSKLLGHKVLPPEYLVRSVGWGLFKKGFTDKAFALFNMNMKNYPSSHEVLYDMGDYYDEKKDSTRAFIYWTTAASLKHNLPNNFFDPSFNAIDYINSHYADASKSASTTILPPEDLVHHLAYLFLMGKMYGKAESLFKLNIQNYPKSSDVYEGMRHYYETIGDKSKAQELKKQALSLEDYQPKQKISDELTADTTFDIYVTTPACIESCPTILIDEAHRNRMTAGRLYKPFANLLSADGFKIVQGQIPFTEQLLENIKVVVIASPFAELKIDEINALVGWIRKGGSLLAITDHSNLKINDLLQPLGVQTPDVEATNDPFHGGRGIVFSEKDNLLGNHPIIRGRNDSERIRKVYSFGGRSIIGPQGSSTLLPLSNSAIDYLPIDPAQRNISRVPVKTKGLRSHGVAFDFGKGKVVVISEARMLTALKYTRDGSLSGMNTFGSDNKQFVLNIVRWLTGYLK